MKRILWGLILVAAGVIWGLNACGVTNIDLFFDGWWTLFIIVPCTIGIFTEEDKTGNVIGGTIGVLLLLACQGILRFEIIWKLILPIILVVFGLKLIFKDVFDKKVKEITKRMKRDKVLMPEYCSTFSGQNVDFTGEKFTGAELTAVFGGIKCDLREAVIEADAVLNICSVFGGIDILVPDNVNVKLSSTCIFGGISDKRKVKNKNNVVTIYINGNCIFGGADIK